MRIALLVLGLMALLAVPSHAEVDESTRSARARLDTAWQTFLEELDQARRGLVDPELFAPAPSDRTLAEGHRYLLGHLGRLIEAEMRLDPAFPEFHRSVDMLRKHTGENPDAIYLKAPVDATGTYLLRGVAADTTEWRTGARTTTSPKAPRMVTFQTITGVPGDTGALAEMGACRSQTLGFVNGFDLPVDAQGRFEILIAPERPAGQPGAYLSSRKEMTCAGTGATAVREARYVAVREIFADWEHEQPLDLSITRVGSEGAARPPIDSAWMAEHLETIGTTVKHHIRFWNQLMEIPLEMRSDRNADGRRNLPVNAMNDAAPPFTAGGVAGAKQLYASGIFELEPGQALVIRVETPVEPHYMGFQLNNLWMEGPDQQNYASSRTAHQNPVASDGARYYVIAHEDPGVPGWIATTGLAKGFQAMRFVYRDDPKPEELPKITTQLTAVDAVRDALPADTPIVDEAARRAEIAIRQEAIKRRYRAY